MDPYDSDSSDGVPSSHRSPQSPKPHLGITWWAGMSEKDDFPTLFQYALNILPYPVMSTECERVFNVKKLITSKKNQLKEDIIKSYKYLKAWWRNSLIEQQFGQFKKQK
jgi:hypothetical protein